MLQSAVLLAVLPVLRLAAPTFSKEGQRELGRAAAGRRQRQRLQRHLATESRRSKAEAVARESLELALHLELTALRHRLLRSQRRVWSAASPEELELQVVLSRWPQGGAFLQAAEATSLTSIGMVLTGVQNLYNTFKEDWSDLQDSLEQLRKELASQSRQMAVNLEIVLKQAAVLLGLLQGLPNFARCLQEALTRPKAGPGRLEAAARVRASTFAGESFDTEGLLGVKLGSLLADARDMRKIVEDSELSQETELDWCTGIRGSWMINGPDPCELLVRSFDSLEGWLSEWLDSGRPQVVFRELQIRQFAAAPNISRIEELSHLLHRTAECCESAVRNPTPDPELLETLQAVARLDEKEVEKEHSLLVEAVVTQFGPSEGLHAVDAKAELARPGLLGLVRRAISAQWVFEMGLLAVASWGDRLKRRGNGLQNRLALVKSSLEDLHSQLRGLASFRRLAFEEIHSAGWWGRSGSGSSKEHTVQIASRLVQFLAHVQPGGVTSLLDVGCGWGEWVPEALEAAKRSGELPAGKFKYLGLDIAYQPIEHLRSKHRDSDLRFEVADGVEDALPQGYAVAMVRHVFQHLNLRDAWRLLSNLWKARPAFVVLSSWPDSQNEDLESFGGSSAFAAMEPASLKNFKSYDLQKPPFSLPEPLDSWPEVHQNARMLAFPGEVLRRFE
ncbi:unnamed protein product [Symbiodinium sp. CCMP2592]|nr:unnamed protein product [Symbiodinium sp. CCMP2592]